MTSVDELAAQLVGIERSVFALSTTPQLAHSSIENGALRAHDDILGETMLIGQQWDGTYAPGVTRGPVPPTPSNPLVSDATEGLVVGWDGTFVGGVVAPMDFLRVDIHIGAISSFVPSHDNRVGSFVAPAGGSASITLAFGTYYVKLVCWTLAGVVSASTDPVEGDSWPIDVSTDGFAPSSSPDPTVLSGIDMIAVRWTPITNADPVRYQVHISTTLGFTPDSTTLVGTTEASSFWIKAMPGPDPLPGDPDERTLQYDVAYYIRIVAVDDDGAAAPSLQAVGSVFQVTGVNLAVDSVTAQNILAGSLTGELFSASVVVAGTFKSGETGQRVEWGATGVQGYRPDGTLILNIPTDGSTALFDGEFIIRGATITGGISIENAENEMKADSAMTLMRGIVGPSATPAITTVWDSVTPNTASLTAAQKTDNDPNWGLGGPFEFEAAGVSCIEWKPSEAMWIFHQIKPNGTRAWFFHSDGTPMDRYGNGTYFTDTKGWEIWGRTEITSGPKAGTYTIFRFIPSGSDWYVNGPNGFNHYTRLNPNGTPAMGTNGTDFFIAESVSTDHLRINYHSMAADGANLPAPSTTYETTTGFSTSVCSVIYNSAGFDIGTARYAAAARGTAYNARLLQISGTGLGSLTPGGSGGWLSSTKDAESWESPTSNRRGMGWDGSFFWTLGGDGQFYKHTGEHWDPSVTSSVIWSGVTFKDTDAGGTGTHETKMGPLKSLTHKRRAQLKFVAPSVPDNGGTDDPDKAQWYAGRGASAPTTPWSTMWAQGAAQSGLATLKLTTLATTGSNPPTTNTFPSANPAKLRNDDDTLVIAGDTTGIKTPALIIGSTQVYAPIHIVTTSTISTLTTAAFSDVTGFSFAAIAGATYAIDCTLFIDNPSSSTPKWRSGWAWTGAGHLSEAQDGLDVNVISPAYNGSSTAHALIDQTTSPVDEGTGFGTPAGIPVLARLAATFVCTSSGTLRLRHAQVTANAAASRVLYGSRMRVQRMV
jgi:hypothetical protein